MSVYIHIPFCSQICFYCDFPKVLKNDNYVLRYLNELEREIKLKYNGEKINTLYIGGGTPTSLSVSCLKKLFDLISIFNLEKDAEITIEANSENLTDEKLKLLKRYVNRLSIGVQTFDSNRLKELNRSININNLKRAFEYFDNINLDLMYGFGGETISDVCDDIDKILIFNPTHISTYSLIIEDNTYFKINDYHRLDEDNDRKIYDFIIDKLYKAGYEHYEISNFARKGFESKHNLTYWNNEHYFGFGLGASGYIDNIRYENTRSLTKYLNGHYILESHELSSDEVFQNELMLGFRKMKGINKNSFYEKYGFNLFDVKEIQGLINEGLLEENNEFVFINPKYIYISNEVLLRLIDVSLPKRENYDIL